MHRKGIAQRYRFQAQTGRQVRPETAGFRNMSDAMYEYIHSHAACKIVRVQKPSNYQVFQVRIWF